MVCLLSPPIDLLLFFVEGFWGAGYGHGDFPRENDLKFHFKAGRLPCWYRYNVCVSF